MYKRYRHQAFLSQNFLRSPELINKLIRKSSIGRRDLVLEIGPGRGVITQELRKIAGHVLAIEKDEKLQKYLITKFRLVHNIDIYRGDFLYFILPTRDYKVFANIPFSITADILRKLTSDRNFQEGYLIVQREAAKKFLGMPYAIKNSMQSVLLKPFFDISVFWEFKRGDFTPIPNVDIVMIYLRRKAYPDVSYTIFNEYKDFITYIFNREKISRFEYVKILQMFESFSKTIDTRQKRVVTQAAKKIRSEQVSLVKIYRTRKDRNWRKF